MNVKKYSQVQFVLTLNEDEAEWLKAVMQNPLHGETPDEEHEEKAKFRHTFFESLKRAGVE